MDEDGAGSTSRLLSQGGRWRSVFRPRAEPGTRRVCTGGGVCCSFCQVAAEDAHEGKLRRRLECLERDGAKYKDEPLRIRRQVCAARAAEAAVGLGWRRELVQVVRGEGWRERVEPEARRELLPGRRPLLTLVSCACS